MKNPSQCRAGKLGLSLGFVLWTNRNRPSDPLRPNVTAGVNGVAGLPTPVNSNSRLRNRQAMPQVIAGNAHSLAISAAL
jgi:hypothetical protein